MDKLKIAEEIIKMAEKDQKLRQSGADAAEIEKWDANHNKRIKEIIGNFGLITISEFGQEVSHKTWLLIQHFPSQDVTFMENYLKLQEENLVDIDKKNYAYLKDRIALYKSIPQTFGTQCVFNAQEKVMRFHTIEDIKNVDQRRYEFGLEPLAEYAKAFRSPVPLPEGYIPLVP